MFFRATDEISQIKYNRICNQSHVSNTGGTALQVPQNVPPFYLENLCLVAQMSKLLGLLGHQNFGPKIPTKNAFYPYTIFLIDKTHTFSE